MPPYQRHIFVCINERPADNPRGCCLAKGSAEVKGLLKDGLKARGISKIVRANSAGCLDACATGITVVIYPEGVWYGRVTAADVDEIIERHVLKGEIIERLLIAPPAEPVAKLPPLDTSSVLRPVNAPSRQGER